MAGNNQERESMEKSEARTHSSLRRKKWKWIGPHFKERKRRRNKSTRMSPAGSGRIGRGFQRTWEDIKSQVATRARLRGRVLQDETQG